MKNNHNYLVANQHLIGNQTLLHNTFKSIEFPVDSGTIKINHTESVTFICNHEGLILFADKRFIENKPLFQCLDQKLILDYIHPEDVSIVIEYLVQLIQEKSDSFIIEARFLCDEDQYLLVKWHVGYLRGLFYLYPINLPNSKPKTNKIIRDFNTTFASPSAQQLWKIEVSKTLFEMDKMISEHLKSCTSV